ncbi:hypothetical protein WJ0W_002341 [Paenibacillus melissococcoides]|uniref:Uncharacterized protein n=1 Tax=Paenibacillus melissococcoides TaxID=2912268 RepID=A0ABN8U229_9BACL|nr:MULTISPECIES: hypothetical protein [Paenibacillus]GIO83009.1 hypothetical protein J6TS7_66190 [Paenibacillus dendritiformis]CAH8245111.1 hypothetical protein WJ0W_002341 [Paenibacillus melissococcoides]CAH8709937.1 hypothetical protein WDD9_002421 [Paenibacillus melissococcoides]CAH8710664.1 hypothetical protein HTL2_002708 [Paenibacillus melissococcoides]
MEKNVVTPKDFALAVVSANPVDGDTPEEKAKNALELYLAAKAVVNEHNSQVKNRQAKAYLDSN